METHVWAVWDFMVLLKSLQRELTCVDQIWTPKGNPVARRLINEIVMGEESDVDAEGRVNSHFEMYLEAMDEAGADTAPIRSFIKALNSGKKPLEALDASQAPEGAKSFVRNTLTVVERGNLAEIAAVFTFGREDLIPDMFVEMVKNLKNHFPDRLAKFTYYLERHIEIDGDEHGHLAEQMVMEICSEDENSWDLAASAAKQALQARYNFWTSVMEREPALS
jgi:pyrroloquinoline quinone (PQQ) biosynthesis protein C